MLCVSESEGSDHSISYIVIAPECIVVNVGIAAQIVIAAHIAKLILALEML